MRHRAAVLCHDDSSLNTLQASLGELGMELVPCASREQALEMVLSRRCSTLIVDFDLPGAEEVIRMAALLPPEQKPALLAVASRVWPGTGQAFQSGASRILYRPLNTVELKDALKNGKKAIQRNQRRCLRYDMKTLVYLELDHGRLPGISIDIGEHGLAVQASEPIPMTSRLPFHCVLPGTDFKLQGYADVIWASDQGRAGLFFSELAPTVRKHLKRWLNRRTGNAKSHRRKNEKQKDAKHEMRELMAPADGHVLYPE
jgi:CheY-like chemotaxis protein